MFELIYPFGPAPAVPAGPDSMKWLAPDGARTEMFPVVEPSGVVVGQASRMYCHSGAKVLHPVVHLHVIDRYGAIYLQKRSMKKDIQPGRWDTAVGGHIDYGESILEALFRESSEELGLRDYNPVYIDSYIFESEIERELVNVFAAVGHFNVVPDYDEVDEGRYWTMDEINRDMGRSVFTPNFESEFSRIRQTLLSLL